MESRYTKVDTDAPILIHSVRADLTPALGKYIHLNVVLGHVLIGRKDE
jgi:hypothetical protein